MGNDRREGKSKSNSNRNRNDKGQYRDPSTSRHFVTLRSG
jgi:hypothetical protein